MNSKLYSVQYLRGLAAVIVVVAHAYVHPLTYENFDFARIGRMGVVLFFVISGFIMVAISGTGTFSPLDFLKRRVIRIVPLYWLFTTAAALMAVLLPSLFKTTVFTVPHYLMSLFFIPHEAPVRGGVNPILTLGWTLNFEVYFYLCFAALAFLAARGRVITMTVVFAALHVLALVLPPESSVLRFYFDYSPLAFCAGAWIGLAALNGKIGSVGSWATPAAIVVAVASLLGTFLFERGTSGSHLVFASLVLLSCAVLFLGLRHESRLPRNRLLEKIGDGSYAIYLVHMFVVGATVAIGYRLLPVDNVWANLVVVSITTIVSILGGILVHEWLEKPILNRLKGERRKVAAVAAQVDPRPAP